MFCLLLGLLYSAEPVNVAFTFQGGGAKGVGAGTIFYEVKQRVREILGEETSVNILDTVNGFSGVSAGAIQAAILAYAKAFRSHEPTTDVTEETYLKKLVDAAAIQAQIKPRGCFSCCWGMCGYTHDPEPLKTALMDVFQNKTLGDLRGQGVRLDILGHNMTVDSPIVFSTENDEHAHLKLWQIVMASAAFPTGYPAQELIINGELVVVCDGGISAKDLLLYELSKVNRGRSDIVVLFGTGDNVVDPKYAKKLQNAGIPGWLTAPQGNIIDRLVDGNTEYSLQSATIIAKNLGCQFFPFQYDTRAKTLDTSQSNVNLILQEVNRYIAENKEQFDNLANLLVQNYRKKTSS